MVLKSGAPSTIAHALRSRTSLASLLLTKRTWSVSVRCWRTPLVELRLRQTSRRITPAAARYPTAYYGQRLPARQYDRVLGSKACFAAFGETDSGSAIRRARRETVRALFASLGLPVLLHSVEPLREGQSRVQTHLMIEVKQAPAVRQVRCRRNNLVNGGILRPTTCLLPRPFPKSLRIVARLASSTMWVTAL